MKPSPYRPNLGIPLLLLGLIVGLFGYSFFQGPAQDLPADGNVGTVLLSVTPPTAPLEYNELVTLPVTVRNLTTNDFEATFPTACTEPTLVMDGTPIDSGLFCAQVLTPVTVPAGSERVMTVKFRIVEEESDRVVGDIFHIGLSPGSHQLRAEWGELVSNVETINVTQ